LGEGAEKRRKEQRREEQKREKGGKWRKRPAGKAVSEGAQTELRCGFCCTLGERDACARTSNKQQQATRSNKKHQEASILREISESERAPSLVRAL